MQTSLSFIYQYLPIHLQKLRIDARVPIYLTLSIPVSMKGEKNFFLGSIISFHCGTCTLMSYYMLLCHYTHSRQKQFLLITNIPSTIRSLLILISHAEDHNLNLIFELLNKRFCKIVKCVLLLMIFLALQKHAGEAYEIVCEREW